MGSPRSSLRVGLGSRNYGYRRVAYDLPVEGVEFRKVAYAPWRILRPKDIRWGNTWLFNPFTSVDLFHLWNGVCLNKKPWVTSFEAHLPRYCGLPRDGLYDASMARIAGPWCRRLLALSDFARQFFLHQNRDLLGSEVSAKCEVFYGAVAVPEAGVATHRRFLDQHDGGPVLCMVGHAFFQKGGLGVLAGFERALSRVPNARLVVVSRLEGGDFVTHTDAATVAATEARLQRARGVEWHRELPHEGVLDVLSRCHAVLLPSLDDTFGWSVVEAMSLGVPALTTNVCALPEIVEPDVRGWRVALPLRIDRRWSGLDASTTDGSRSEALSEARERIADGVANLVEELAARPEVSRRLGEAALAHVRAVHDPRLQATRLRAIYDEALELSPPA